MGVHFLADGEGFGGVAEGAGVCETDRKVGIVALFSGEGRGCRAPGAVEVHVGCEPCCYCLCEIEARVCSEDRISSRGFEGDRLICE